jgi:hypothetical protein
VHGPPAVHKSTGATTTIKLSINELHPLEFQKRQQSLLAESWNPQYANLGFDRDSENPPFLKPAVEELAKSDGKA